jgi:hypothetical protein
MVDKHCELACVTSALSRLQLPLCLSARSLHEALYYQADSPAHSIPCLTPTPRASLNPVLISFRAEVVGRTYALERLGSETMLLIVLCGILDRADMVLSLTFGM